MNQQEQQLFLLNTFREEIDGHTVNLTRELVELEEAGATPEQVGRVREIMRLLHTVKGAARMMGFQTISRVAHLMEELVADYRDTALPVEIPRQTIDLLFEGLDVISELTREAVNPNPGGETSVFTAPEVVQALIDKMAFVAGKPELAGEAVNPTPVPASPSVPVESELNPASRIEIYPVSANGNGNGYSNTNPPGTTALNLAESVVLAVPYTTGGTEAPVENRPDLRSNEETIRVRLDKLDNLINMAGELVINKQQNEEHLESLQELMQQARSRNQVAHQLREFIIERTPVEERNRLLGITELFSFDQQAIAGLMEPAQLAPASYPTRTSSYELPGRGNQGEEVFGLSARDLKTVFNKIEDLISRNTRMEQHLAGMIRERKNYNLRFATAADELRQNMLGIRMLPLDTIFGRFARPIRDLAYERGKEVKLVITGGSIEVDKRILEQIADPLIHLLRNSVDHGLEFPSQRQAAGKAVEGNLKLAASQKGNRVLIEISDDGRGIDPEELRRTAISKGFISQAAAMALTDEAALELIYRNGFSTRQNADDISGRGVGLDLVQHHVKRLNGLISIKTTIGQGTTFQIEIPLTLSTIDALIVGISGQLFALPSTMIAGTFRGPRTEMQTIENHPVMRIRGQLMPVVSLADLLQLPPEETLENNAYSTYNRSFIHGVLVGAGAGGPDQARRFICFEVDTFIDEREVVVKGLGAFLENTPNVAGVTVLGADSLAVILDTFSLVQSVRHGSSVTFGGSVSRGNATSIMAQRRYHTILVVDDSLATRELERSILETAGYRVDTARDGLEALKACRERRPDLVLTDVEMPNMDGFRLSLAIRQDDRLNDLPVIIVSSRDSDEDRRKGLDAGAQAYIVKGQFEQNKLLDTISLLLSK